MVKKNKLKHFHLPGLAGIKHSIEKKRMFYGDKKKTLEAMGQVLQAYLHIYFIFFLYF